MFKYITVLVSFLPLGIIAQSQIVKIDSETGSFKNFPELPFNETFIIEGEIAKNIDRVEIIVVDSKSKNDEATYIWNRSINNTKENFEIIITDVLKPSSEYNFEIVTYKNISKTEKSQIVNTIFVRLKHQLQNNIITNKRSLEIEHPKALFNSLNEIIISGISMQRSTNGVEFNGLSDLIKDELDNLKDVKIKAFLKRKKGLEKEEIKQKTVDDKINYITESILAEVAPFFNSTLVQQHHKYKINNVRTKRDQFTLPINGGLYSWTNSVAASGISTKNSGLTPGFGFTIPFKRSFSVAGKKLPTLGLSFGVLTSSIVNVNGDQLATPSIGLPVYAGLGVNFFKVIRINAGTLVVTPKDKMLSQKLQFIPTIGLTLELDAWLGIRK